MMEGNRGKMRKEGHRCYSLKAHVVLCTKYRKKIIEGALRTNLEGVIDYISRGGMFDIEQYNSDGDHIHMLIDYRDEMPLRKIIYYVKSMSAREMWKSHEDILSLAFRHKRKFWSAGVFYRSVGEGDVEAVREYIENQGKEKE